MTGFSRRLAMVAGLALALRVAYVLIERRHADVWGDSYFYHHAANLIADGKGWVNPLPYSLGIVQEAADHPPLYIAYLAAWSFLGVTSPLGHMLVSTLIGACTVAVAGL